MKELRYTPESIGRDDPGFARSTELYLNSTPPKGGGRIGVGMTDTGAANAIMPALKLLDPVVSIRVLAREVAANVVSSDPHLRIAARHWHPSHRIENIRADVILTGMASNPTLELLINAAAYEKGIPSVAIEDYPGAYGSELRNCLEDPFLRPDRIMVMNVWAKDANLEALRWLKPEQVLVTGQPAFDYIAQEDPDGKKKEIYPELGLDEGEELVVFMGQKRGTPRAFEMVVDGLPRDLDYRLAIRRHPRDVVPMEVYEDMAGPLRSRLVNTDNFPTSVIGAIADRVITIFSTEGMSSVMRGKPTLHILNREVLAETEVPNIVVPVTRASHVINQISESRSLIARLFNPDANAGLQEEMALWKPDGKAGERVARSLIEIAQGNL